MKKKVTNNGGVTAIYVRRSVADRDNNSLSIESQKEDHIRYVGEDCAYRLYCDNGKGHRTPSCISAEICVTI